MVIYYLLCSLLYQVLYFSKEFGIYRQSCWRSLPKSWWSSWMQSAVGVEWRVPVMLWVLPLICTECVEQLEEMPFAVRHFSRQVQAQQFTCHSVPAVRSDSCHRAVHDFWGTGNAQLTILTTFRAENAENFTRLIKTKLYIVRHDFVGKRPYFRWI